MLCIFAVAFLDKIVKGVQEKAAVKRQPKRHVAQTGSIADKTLFSVNPKNEETEIIINDLAVKTI